MIDRHPAETAATNAELAARKEASDREWRIAAGWPDPNPPDRVPDAWQPRHYVCDTCHEEVVWTTANGQPTADLGKWRHTACTAARRLPRIPRAVELP